MRSKSKSAPVGVITKVLTILELLDRAPHGLQLRDLAEKTGLNKSTVHRFASHLEAEAGCACCTSSTNLGGRAIFPFSKYVFVPLSLVM